MGRQLEKMGAPFRQPEWSALALMEDPESVKEVHKAFLKSGSEIITTNSYALVPFHLGEERFRTSAFELATPLIEGLNSHVDLWLCETMGLIDEPLRIKSLVERLDREAKPFWVSFTLEDDPTNKEPLLRSGESVVLAVQEMVKAGVGGILFNCCMPEVIGDALRITKAELARLGLTPFPSEVMPTPFPLFPRTPWPMKS